PSNVRNRLVSLSRTSAADRLPHGKVQMRTSIPFFVLHLVPLLAIFTGVSTTAWVLLAVTYWTRMFCITAGYHRYFAHRSYRTSRAFQFLLAAGGASASQKGPLWWAGHHRLHHRFSDTERDPHTPRKGFWWSHCGWVLGDDTKDTPTTMKDFEKFPEIRFISRFDWIPVWGLALICLAIGGWSGLLIGFVLSTVLLWHSTFLVNSLAHVWGGRRWDTTDTSRNNVLIALLTMGEGWHNNHHHQAYVCRQGRRWWEIDATYYVLLVLERLHIVWDLRQPRDDRSDTADATADDDADLVPSS
ncbi:MAG: acyl-CoA desaturase, partial [Actinomycetes bacterium]